MKELHYFFVVGIVGAIIAGGYSLGQVVDIGSFEVLPEANADGIEGTTGDYAKYANYTISPGYYKTIAVSCNSGDKATGYMDYHRPNVEIYKSYPVYVWDSSIGDYYVSGMRVTFHNTASYNNFVVLYVFCTSR